MLAYKLERAIPASLSQLQQHEAIRNIAAPPCSKSIVLQVIVKSGKTLVHHNGVSSALLQFTLTVYQHPFGLLAGGGGGAWGGTVKEECLPKNPTPCTDQNATASPTNSSSVFIVCMCFFHSCTILNKQTWFGSTE